MTPHRPRFLVVDDALDETRATSLLLQAEGVRPDDVEEAYSATEALRRIGDRDPDVVLLDLGLPDMGGDALARRIIEADPDALVVVLTPLDEVDPRVRRALENGADHVIPKPMDRDHARALADLARRGGEPVDAADAPL